MKLLRCIKLPATLTALALAVPAFAEIKLNENFSTSGYVVGTYQFTDLNPGGSTDSLNSDVAKALFTASFKPVTGVVSFYYAPNAPREVTVLDAYATYDFGTGVTVTGGKFLSYMGYEAFDPVNMDQISYANGGLLAPIPGYHTGLKLDYSTETIGIGLAVVDSVYSGPNYLKGDGELRDNGGFEAYLAYKGVKNLTLWAGIAYESEGSFQSHAVTLFDFWAAYTTGAHRFAGEFAVKDAGVGNRGYNWLAFYNYAVTEKTSTTFRLSGEKVRDAGGSFLKYTIAPGTKITPNLTVRAELSYTDYKDLSVDSATFVGVQALFSF